MKKILARFSKPPTIPHFRVDLSIRKSPKNIRLMNLWGVNKKSPAIFVSFNGFMENLDRAMHIRNQFSYFSATRKIPLHTFLDDNINGLTYYIATMGHHIAAIDPYCKIGDLTNPVKSYINVYRLLQYFGVKYEKLRKEQSHVWVKHLQATKQQQQFTRKWLKIVKNKLQTQIPKHRNIKPQTLSQFGNKIITSKRALQLNLIDKITTMQQYAAQHFPGHVIINHLVSTKPRRPDFTDREMDVLVQMVEWIGMSNGQPLISNGDPFTHVVNGFIDIVSMRIEDPEKMDSLDQFIGELFGKFMVHQENCNRFIV